MPGRELDLLYRASLDWLNAVASRWWSLFQTRAGVYPCISYHSQRATSFDADTFLSSGTRRPRTPYAPSPRPHPRLLPPPAERDAGAGLQRGGAARLSAAGRRHPQAQQRAVPAQEHAQRHQRLHRHRQHAQRSGLNPFVAQRRFLFLRPSPSSMSGR